MTDCTYVVSTSTKPTAAAAVAVAAEAAVADKSANVAGSCCAARVYDEEMGRRADCAGWTHGVTAAVATESHDAATEWRDGATARDAATVSFPRDIHSGVVASVAAANGSLPWRRRRMTMERHVVAAALLGLHTKNCASVATHLYD